MQTECRISSLLEYYTEVQLILCKDNARREQYNPNVIGDLLPSHSLSYAKIIQLLLNTKLKEVKPTYLVLTQPKSSIFKS